MVSKCTFKKGQRVIINPKTGSERLGRIHSCRSVTTLVRGKRTVEYTFIEHGKRHYFYGFELGRLPRRR